MNDFEQCLKKCAPVMYADYSSVTCCAEDMEELCSESQNELSKSFRVDASEQGEFRCKKI